MPSMMIRFLALLAVAQAFVPQSSVQVQHQQLQAHQDNEDATPRPTMTTSSAAAAALVMMTASVVSTSLPAHAADASLDLMATPTSTTTTTMTRLPSGRVPPPPSPFRQFLASTKISELLGVEPVEAREDTLLLLSSFRPPQDSASALKFETSTVNRKWWHEVGDYLEDPHRHFATMQQLRVPMDWPADIITEDDVVE